MIHKTTNQLLSIYDRVVTRFAEKQLRQIICNKLKLTPIGEFQEDDIFIVGYPKSGNTWFRFLVAGAIYGIDLELAPSALVYDLVPDVHHVSFYKRFHTPMFFKSHHIPRPEYKHVVYLIRDGRDVMISYLHHLCAIHGDNIALADLFQNDALLEFGRWHEHVEAWLQNPFRARLMITKYEDLIKHPLEELRRLCDFVGVERSDSLLDRVIEQTSFQVMQNRENQNENFRENPLWPKNKNFFRRGKIGSHKDEMPPDLVVAFLEESGDTLRKLGYLQED